MLWRLSDTLHRDSRRLVFVTTLAFVAGVLFYARLDAVILGLPAPIFTGLLYASIIGPVAFLICAFVPSLRFFIEAIAVSRLVLAAFVFACPNIGTHILASPLLTAMLVVSGAGIISRYLHGELKRPETATWREKWFSRRPALVSATPRQMQFVHWMDRTAPVPA